jgi:hypothetical protein
MNVLALLIRHVLPMIFVCCSSILVYDTEQSNVTEYSTCIHHMTDSSMKCCIRPGRVHQLTTKVDNCRNGGMKWLFTSLLQANISPTEVLSWSSSIERADNYASYYYNESHELASTDEFLCECTLPGTLSRSSSHETESILWLNNVMEVFSVICLILSVTTDFFVWIGVIFVMDNSNAWTDGTKRTVTYSSLMNAKIMNIVV